MATEPPSYLSSQCGYTLSTYLYMCGPFGYVYRAQHGRAKEPYGSSARSLCCARYALILYGSSARSLCCASSTNRREENLRCIGSRCIRTVSWVSDRKIPTAWCGNKGSRWSNRRSFVQQPFSSFDALIREAAREVDNVTIILTKSMLGSEASTPERSLPCAISDKDAYRLCPT
jgi:hypothetical protein